MPMLTINEGAGVLKLSRWTVAAMLESGQLPGVIIRSGRRKKVWRISEQALQKWIETREQETKKLIQGERALKAVGS